MLRGAYPALPASALALSSLFPLAHLGQTALKASPPLLMEGDVVEKPIPAP